MCVRLDAAREVGFGGFVFDLMISAFRRHACKLFVALFMPALLGWATFANAAPPLKLSGALSSSFGTLAGITASNTRVVFLADRKTDSQFELYSVDVAGGSITKLSGGMALGGGQFSSVVISPNGLWVAFEAYGLVSGKLELWVAAIDGNSAPSSLSGPISTRGGPFATGFLWTPDSSRVVFTADRDVTGVFELYSVEIANGYPVTKLSGSLVNDGDVHMFVKISADGTRVVFQADKDVDGVMELYSVPVDGATAPIKISGAMPINGGSVVYYFLVSPDSSRVVFLAGRELYSVPIDGTVPIKISGSLPPGVEASNDFVVSADSGRVVFRANKDLITVQELYSVPIAGTTPTKISGSLVAGGNVSRNFRISPDGTKVVFRADKDVNDIFELYSVPIVGGGEPVKISGALVSGGGVTDFYANEFRIVADGSRVAFHADKDVDGVFELYSAAIDGGAIPLKLSGALVTGGSVTAFRLAPDGKHIVFAANKDNAQSWELFAVPASGGSPIKVSGPFVIGGAIAAGTFAFELSPDSKRVVFRADKDTDEVFEVYSAALNGDAGVLDIDGDGLVTPTIDGLMLMRWQLGVRGAALFGGITFPVGATRTTAVAIEDHLRRLSETPMGW